MNCILLISINIIVLCEASIHLPIWGKVNNQIINFKSAITTELYNGTFWGATVEYSPHSLVLQKTALTQTTTLTSINKT